jgi:hypothetical protein
MILAFCDPALAALFTPAAPTAGRYEVCTHADPIDALAEAGRADGRHFSAAEALESLDAFGTGGTYDRSRLARLYGGTRVRVAHGWKESADRFESYTLLSPYPDASLAHLNPGTMEIHWVLSRSTQNPQNRASDANSARSSLWIDRYTRLTRAHAPA